MKKQRELTVLFLFIIASLTPVLGREHVPQRDHVPPVALVAAAAPEQVRMGIVAVPLFDLSADAAFICGFLGIHHISSFLLFVGSRSISFLILITVLMPLPVSLATSRTG